MGTSSSSATIWRIAARPPVPRSTLPVKTVTVLSAWIARKASTWSGATVLPRYRSAGQPAAGALAAACAAAGRADRPPSPSPTTSAPPAPRNVRRVIGVILGSSHRARGAHHRPDHPDVAPASAEVPRQRLLDLGLGRPAVLLEKRPRGHDEARGAVAALRGLLRDERRLDRIRPLGRAEPLDRRDLAADGRADGRRRRSGRPGRRGGRCRRRTGRARTRTWSRSARGRSGGRRGGASRDRRSRRLAASR